MSKTDPACYPPHEGALGWHDDRDWLDRIFDEWNEGAERLEGIQRAIYLCGSPFPDDFELGFPNRSKSYWRFPIPSNYMRPCARARKSHLTAQLEQLINRCEETPKC
jgi:hypothetical protein